MALKKKLVYGVGINDADYVVKKWKTIEVDGKKKRKLVWVVLSTKFGGYA